MISFEILSADLSRDIKAPLILPPFFLIPFLIHAKTVICLLTAQFYLRILKDGAPINTRSSGELKIISWVVCEPEKPKNQPGKMVKNELYLDFKQNVENVAIGDLRIKSDAFSYTTDAKNDYARSGKLNLTPITEESTSKILVNDVQFVEFSVAGTLPPEKPVDFFPISVKIRTLYPKDDKVFKENSIMATPQVGIDTF